MGSARAKREKVGPKGGQVRDGDLVHLSSQGEAKWYFQHVGWSPKTCREKLSLGRAPPSRDRSPVANDMTAWRYIGAVDSPTIIDSGSQYEQDMQNELSLATISASCQPGPGIEMKKTLHD